MRLILCLIPRMDSWMLMPVDANFWNPSDSSKRPYHYHYHYQIIKYQIINHKSCPKKKRKAQNSRGSWWRGQVWVTGHYFISRSEWVSEWGSKSSEDAGPLRIASTFEFRTNVFESARILNPHGRAAHGWKTMSNVSQLSTCKFQLSVSVSLHQLNWSQLPPAMHNLTAG